jgi:hypothetical protein
MLKFLERWQKRHVRRRHEKYLHEILPAPHHSALRRGKYERAVDLGDRSRY